MALDITQPPQSWADTYWTIGTGSTTGFSQNGSTDENSRLYGLDPWGRRSILWQGVPDGLSYGGDGGWVTSSFSVDSTKLYRFSVWANMFKIGTQGKFYFGAHGYGTTNGVTNLQTISWNTNPYFWYSGNPPTTDMIENTWYLIVGHIYPAGTTHTSYVKHVDSGRWETNGTKKGSSIYDYAWNSSSTTGNHRTYLYYADTYTDAILRWCYPRVDLCDGTEPTLKDLLRNGRSYMIANLLIN